MQSQKNTLTFFLVLVKTESMVTFPTIVFNSIRTYGSLKVNFMKSKILFN